MSDGRCGTCKWYVESKYNWKNGSCLKFDQGYMADKTFTAIATVTPSSDYSQLEVTPDFGCVLWESKEKANG